METIQQSSKGGYVLFRFFACCLFVAFMSQFSYSSDQLLVEAESFAKRGGWKLDTQFIHEMGSPYLLAHGIGRPVKDATTNVKFPSTGKYKVFVRTKDWVARWDAKGSPGKFQLSVGGKRLNTVFGTQGKKWLWHDGGTVDISSVDVELGLHDLTGFDGRCDAILFTKDLKAVLLPCRGSLIKRMSFCMFQSKETQSKFQNALTGVKDYGLQDIEISKNIYLFLFN